MPALPPLLVAVLVAVLPAPAAAARPCPPPERVVAATAQAVVYRAGEVTRACWRATGRRTTLGVATLDETGPQQVRVAGRFAATTSIGYDRYTGDASGQVELWDLRAGRWRASWSAYRANLSRDDPDPLAPAVTTLAVAPSGVVVFAVDTLRPPGWAVHRLAFRAHTVLDRGPDVDPASVRLRGGRITWVRGGRPRSAPLRPSPPARRPGRGRDPGRPEAAPAGRPDATRPHAR
jgi:hypothetical protein